MNWKNKETIKDTSAKKLTPTRETRKSQTVQNNNLTFFLIQISKNSIACTDHYNRRADLDPLQNRSWELHNLENTKVR